MAWPNPFRRHTENTINTWGYIYESTPQHPTLEDFEPLKHSYDQLAERCLEELNRISPPDPRVSLPRNNPQQRGGQNPSKEGAKAAPSPPKRDLVAVLKANHEKSEVLQEFWKEVNHVPEWVDWDQVARGQDVFYRYGGANITGLAYQSLLGGMGAARVVETLARTGGFSTKVARGRLYETTQHILQCTKSLESIQPGGDGWASTIRVRLLHSAVRNRIMKLTQTKPEYYNVKEWGIPINDLDSIATIATFSSTLIWMSLPRQGLYLRKQEIEDYIALWRYIAHIIGAPTFAFATPEKAQKWMESLFRYEINPTETSKLLANNIIMSLCEKPPVFASSSMLIASARWLNGNALCDSLGLARPSIYYWFLMAGQCTFFMVMGYTYRLFPSADSKKVKWMRDIFWSIIVDHESGLQGKITNFDFKYIPEFETVTEIAAENSEEMVKQNMLLRRSSELRNLRWLGVAVGVLGIGAIGFWRVTGLVLGVLWR